MNLELGIQFRNARKKLGLSQKEVSLEVDISPSYYSEIESDQKIPTIEIFLKICKVLMIKPNLFEDYDYHKINLVVNYIIEELSELTQDESLVIIDTMRTMIAGIKKIKK